MRYIAPDFVRTIFRSEECLRAERDLVSLINRLNRLAREKGVRYAVVGGVAIEAYSHTRHHPIRANGTIRDVDLIILEDPNGEVRTLEKDLQKENCLLGISFNFVRPLEYRSVFQLLAHFKRTAEGYSLVFRRIEEPLPWKTVTLSKITLRTDVGNVRISTFPPATILHLYLHRMGQLKHKDKKKVRAFARIVARHKCGHDAWKPLHRFSRTVRSSYPFYHWCVRLYNFMDHVCCDRLSPFLLRNVSYRMVNI